MEIVSRFEDGSARVTYDELAAGWATWSEHDRIEFSQNCTWLRGQHDFSDILRFIAAHGGPHEWDGVALPIAYTLPAAEAFATLQKMFEASVIGTRSNLVQAIGSVEHAGSLELVVADIRALAPLEATWHPDGFVNWHASELLCAVLSALKLGANAADYTDLVRRLAAHPSPANAAGARRDLCRHYPEVFAPTKVDSGSELPDNVLPFAPRRR
ncbi:MAG TPA: hypothetical protein PLR99_23120 [Polyangiaceae bacterium]|nr:hypothetical protein [Polyangiaceae bacterium]